jgi:glutathione S-transferase
VIAESEVINEFLEDKSPEKPLLPKGAESRARVRRLTRFNDLYLDPPARALLPLVFGRKLDDSVVHARLAEISSRLDLLESIIGSPWAAGEWFTLADAALTPTFFFIVGFTKQLGSQDPLEGRPRLSAWWTRVHEYPSTERALAEQESALNAILKK